MRDLICYALSAVFVATSVLTYAEYTTYGTGTKS